MTALVDVRGLRLLRERRQILEVDALSVESGQVLAVVGPNGAGKSSLLLALARLLKPERGEIYFRGERADAMSGLDYRRRLGLVLQEPMLLETSVFENVAAGLRFRHIPRDEITRRVEAWLARLGIAPLRHRPAAKLSGGEAQRVSLARAFVLQPELLLLDEPFSSLDSPTRTRLLDDLQSLLAETSTTTILVTHDLSEAARLAGKVAVLLNGQLRQVGPTDQVFSHPIDEEVAAFLGKSAG